MIVEAQHLVHGFGADRVLNDVSLSVSKPGVVSIVGPNGAGKTTLLRCLNGLIRPDHGRVRILDADLGHIPTRSLAGMIAYVPQTEPTRFPITVFDAVMLGRRRYLGWRTGTADLDAVAAALARLGLEQLAFRRMGELSGGERQRVVMARAVAQDTPILLLDEPTSHLDLAHQLLIADVVCDLVAERGASVVMTVHDLNLAVRASDEIVVLDGGQVAYTGAPRHITPALIETVWGVTAKVVDAGTDRVVVPTGRTGTSPSSAGHPDPDAPATPRGFTTGWHRLDGSP